MRPHLGAPLGPDHRTGVDNYEWLHGWELPFGLLDRERRVRASAAVLRDAMRA